VAWAFNSRVADSTERISNGRDTRVGTYYG
jgi:hypothetical protein